jgi:ABC-type oligopeptide transport system ATPase subunit
MSSRYPDILRMTLSKLMKSPITLNLRPNNRGLIVGKTGSGKTTLAKYLLYGFRRVLVLDNKGLIKWEGFKIARSRQEFRDFSARFAHVVFVPPEYGNVDDNEYFFDLCYLTGHCVVYVDEVYACSNRDEIPSSYKAIITRGRERGIACLSSTQRPKLIPQILFSESEQFYVFELRLAVDRQKVASTIDIREEDIPKKRYDFWYSDIERDVTIGPLRLSLS